MKKKDNTTNPVKIFVMDRGWVLVGRIVTMSEKLTILNNCHVVRRWGTKKGLGELATKGPLSETVLDKEGDGIEITNAFIHHTIPCGNAWEKW